MIRRLLALGQVKHSDRKPRTLRLFLFALFTLRDGFCCLFVFVGGGGVGVEVFVAGVFFKAFIPGRTVFVNFDSAGCILLWLIQ